LGVTIHAARDERSGQRREGSAYPALEDLSLAHVALGRRVALVAGGPLDEAGVVRPERAPGDARRAKVVERYLLDGLRVLEALAQSAGQAKKASGLAVR
jgi:hypothetical protein